MIVCAPLLGSELMERRTAADTGVGEAGIHPAEHCQCFGEGALHGNFTADVAGDDVCFHAMRCQCLQRCCILVGVGTPDADIGAMLGDTGGEAQADAAVAAGDQCGLAGEIEQVGTHVRGADGLLGLMPECARWATGA